MATVSRLAGSLLAQSGERYFLVGDLKEPCDFAAAGFEHPGEIEAMQTPYVELKLLDASQPPEHSTPRLVLDLDTDDEALPKLIHKSMVIRRNASVSDRLWFLITEAEENDGDEEVNIQWLANMPAEIWEIVRDEVLRCI